METMTTWPQVHSHSLILIELYLIQSLPDVRVIVWGIGAYSYNSAHNTAINESKRIFRKSHECSCVLPKKEAVGCWIGSVFNHPPDLVSCICCDGSGGSEGKNPLQRLKSSWKAEFHKQQSPVLCAQSCARIGRGILTPKSKQSTCLVAGQWQKIRQTNVSDRYPALPLKKGLNC